MCRKTAESVSLTKDEEGNLVIMDIESYNRREKMCSVNQGGGGIIVGLSSNNRILERKSSLNCRWRFFCPCPWCGGGLIFPIPSKVRNGTP